LLKKEIPDSRNIKFFGGPNYNNSANTKNYLNKIKFNSLNLNNNIRDTDVPFI
jgi:hypothetical protein